MTNSIDRHNSHGQGLYVGQQHQTVSAADLYVVSYHQRSSPITGLSAHDNVALPFERGCLPQGHPAMPRSSYEAPLSLQACVEAVLYNSLDDSFPPHSQALHASLPLTYNATRYKEQQTRLASVFSNVLSKRRTSSKHYLLHEHLHLHGPPP